MSEQDNIKAVKRKFNKLTPCEKHLIAYLVSVLDDIKDHDVDYEEMVCYFDLDYNGINVDYGTNYTVDQVKLALKRLKRREIEIKYVDHCEIVTTTTVTTNWLQSIELGEGYFQMILSDAILLYLEYLKEDFKYEKP